jgi:sugar/nucleoside kinase (ribokinase family)
VSPLLLAAGYVNVDVIATVERVPGFGERVTAGSIFRATGGMTANAACAAARLGLGTEFFGRVGNDTEGETALAEMRRFGVGTGWVVRSQWPTTTALVLLRPDGERAIVSEPMNFDYGPLEEAMEGLAGEEDVCVHVDGYRLPEALGILSRARELGFYASADLDGLAEQDLRAFVAEISASLDIILINRQLAKALAPKPESAAKKLVDQGTGTVAITLGAQGAVVAERGWVRSLSAPRVDVCDATGAGDVFAGAFLASWLERSGAEEAGRLAVAASAISVGGYGARGRLPNREEAERLARSIVADREGLEERSNAE